jgi:hypothetical protein
MLDVTDRFNEGSVTANQSTVLVEGRLSGGTITLNNSLLMIGTNQNYNPSVTGGTITFGSGTTDTALITNPGSSNSVNITGFYNNDAIGINTPFTTAALSGTTLTLKNGSTTVATFTNVHLASGAATTFFPVTPETVNGITYYLATLDPPGATGTTGPTGAAGSTGTTGTAGATGASDPLWSPINPKTLLGDFANNQSFLHADAGNLNQPADGEHHKHDQTAGGQLATDLTSIAGVNTLTQNTGNSQAGSQTQRPDGIGGFGNLDDQNKQHLKDLIGPDKHGH